MPGNVSDGEQRVATLILLNASFCHDLWVLSWQLQDLLVKSTFCWKRRQLSKCQIRIPQDFPRHQVSSIPFILDLDISCQLLLWNVALWRKKLPRMLLWPELCCNGTVNFALTSAEKPGLKNKLLCHFSKSEEAYALPAVWVGTVHLMNQTTATVLIPVTGPDQNCSQRLPTWM